MRSLNEIVTRRATEAIATAAESAQDAGETLSERQIAARMAEFMGSDAGSVLKQLRRYLEGSAKWRIDYIESLSQSLGLTPRELVSLDPDASVTEATRAQFLLTSVSPRLDASSMRHLASTLNKLLDDTPAYELGIEILSALTKRTDIASTRMEVSDLIRESGIFDGKRKHPKKKRARDKKSTSKA